MSNIGHVQTYAVYTYTCVQVLPVQVYVRIYECIVTMCIRTYNMIIRVIRVYLGVVLNLGEFVLS